MSVSPILVSIVPAAGHSIRMGGHDKLLLPWKQNSTVIDEVLRAWTESQTTRVVVVVRADDILLQQVCRKWPRVELVIPPNDPRDMKESVLRGLEFLSRNNAFFEIERWFVAPADMPTLNARIINRIIEANPRRDSIVIPLFNGRRGHPISLPWSLSERVAALAENEGIDRLLRDHPIEYLEISDELRPEDIDTPEDYLRLRKQYLI